MDARFRGHDDESITPAAARRRRLPAQAGESGGPWPGRAPDPLAQGLRLALEIQE